MSRCFFQPRSPSFRAPPWLPSLTNISSGSRGLLRLCDVAAMDPSTLKGPGIRTTSYWNAILAQHNIGTGSGFERAPGPKAYQLQIRLSTKHHRNEMDFVYFDAHEANPFTEAVVRRCLRHDRERPLWLYFKLFGDVKSVVRGQFRKRAIAAWRQALRNNGYDAHGTGLAGKEGLELFGTVDMKSDAPLVVYHTPFVDLRRHLERVVKAMEPQLRRPVGGGGTRPSVRSVPETQHSRYSYMQERRPWHGDKRKQKKS